MAALISRRLSLAAVTLATALAAAPAVAGRPAALVEDVTGAGAGVQPLDYLSAGQVVNLAAGDTLTLGYLASCAHERITGGKVTVGERESKVENGKVERSKVECDGGRLVLAANQAVQSGAIAVRSLGRDDEVKVMVFDTSPLITLPRAGSVVIKRVDIPGERHKLDLEAAADAATRVRLDLAERGIELAPGGTYMVSVAGVAQLFRVAEGARHGEVPLIGRLVPF